MKKTKNVILIILLVVVIFIVGVVASGVGAYNSIVGSEENVNKALSNIDTQLQRRADLIPNLVNTVKGYMKHEQDIIDSITEARQNLVNASTLEDKDQANKALTDAINQLYIVVENYPDLKANTNFIALQDEIAGSENRVAVARKDYNEAVNNYNTMIKRFPNNLIASMFGFESKEYFQADSDANEVPEVSFD